MTRNYALYVNSNIHAWTKDNMIRLREIEPGVKLADKDKCARSFIAQDNGCRYKLFGATDINDKSDAILTIHTNLTDAIYKVLRLYLKQYTTDMNTIDLGEMAFSSNFYSINVKEFKSMTSIWIPVAMWALGIAALLEHDMMSDINNIPSQVLCHMIDEKLAKIDPIEKAVSYQRVVFTLSDVDEFNTLVLRFVDLKKRKQQIRDKINAIQSIRDVERIFSSMLEDAVSLNDMIQESTIDISVKNRKTSIEQHLLLNMNTEPNSYKVKVCGYCDVIYTDPACKTDKQ